MSKLSNEKPNKNSSGFQVPKSILKDKREKAKDTSGAVNARLEAKLDYIIQMLEERG